MRFYLSLLLVLPLAALAQVPEAAPAPSQAPQSAQVPAAAQATEAGAADSMTLRTTVSEVLLDVVVRKKDGKIIRDLKPGEVQVFEDGVPQKMRHFEFIDGRAPVQPPRTTTTNVAASSTTGTAPGAPLSVNQLRDMSVVSVVIANIDPRGRTLAQNAMKEFVQKEVDPNTYVGVFTLGLGGLRVMQPYTNDGPKIAAAVEQTVNYINSDQPVTGELFHPQIGLGMGNDPNDPTSGSTGVPGIDNPTGTQTPDTGGTTSQATASANGPAALIATLSEMEFVNELQDVYHDSMRFLTPLQSLIQAQAQIPGRKVVLLFTAGLPVSPDSVELLRSVISTANRANVTVYAVDTRGVTSYEDLDASRRLLNQATSSSRRQMLSRVNGGDQAVTPAEAIANELGDAAMHADLRENLVELATGTGGELLPDDLNLIEPLTRAMEDVRTHYELSYSPTNLATDGSFRKIEVKVSRSGARVFAREGYYALPVLNGRQVYPFEMATLKAINTRPILHQFNFHAAALEFRPGAEQTQMAFVFQAPTHDLTVIKDGQRAKVHVCVTALVRDEDGKIVQKISKDIPYSVPVEKMAELEQGTVNFTTPFLLAPGTYTLETAAVDRQSMKASVKRSVLVVDQASGLSMSDVALARRIDPVSGPEDAFDPLEENGEVVTPEMSSVIRSVDDGNLEFYAVAYPPRPVDAPVDASIEIWQNGRMVVRTPASPVKPDSSGAATILAGIPTDKMPAGIYEAHVVFEFKGQKVSKAIPFILTTGS
ncbi:MAG: VWA domain-containing protein [Terracidiphilus sp.]